MTQDDFIHLMKKQADGKITLPQAKIAFYGFIGAVREVMCAGDNIVLPDLGRIGSKMKGGHEATDFKTMTRYKVDDHLIPFFKPFPNLRKEVWDASCSKN